MKPHFFKTQAAFRAWLEKNHNRKQELVVGYWKKSTRKASVTWEESRDEALCFGWIDGIRRKIDDESYCIRFTPRKPTSIWSAVNVARVDAMIAQKKMTPAGMAAFDKRDEKKTAVYSYERETAKISGDLLVRFKAHKAAHAFFMKQPPGYRRVASYWVVSAKREATRLRRLDQLIEVSEQEERLPQVASPSSRRASRVKRSR